MTTRTNEMDHRNGYKQAIPVVPSMTNQTVLGLTILYHDDCFTNHGRIERCMN